MVFSFNEFFHFHYSHSILYKNEKVSCQLLDTSLIMDTSLGFLVPPYWIIEPKDTNSKLSEEVLLECKAGGSPSPTIIWKKQTGIVWIFFPI